MGCCWLLLLVVGCCCWLLYGGYGGIGSVSLLVVVRCGFLCEMKWCL